MDLYYTPRSHFSRKVRILLNALGLDINLIDIGNVANATGDIFGPNPLMKIPTLVDDDRVVFESDHIAYYLIRKHDREDRFNVIIEEIPLLNARAVMNGIMSAGVEIILAQRTGIDTARYLRFQKLYESIKNSLAWLEQHAELFDNTPSYSNFHLTCMWDHLSLYSVLPLEYDRLKNCIEQTSRLSYVASTAPPCANRKHDEKPGKNSLFK